MMSFKPSLFLCATSFLLMLGSVVAQVSSDETQRCQSNWRQIRERLRISRRKWSRRGADCYDMTIERECFCPPDFRFTHNLRVVDNEIQNPSKAAKAMPTVEELFDLVDKYCVKDCPGAGAASCRVRFDRKLGYVKSLYIDVATNIADEEINYKVKDLALRENK